MPDTLSCLIPIHVWHLDIHKYQIIGFRWQLLYPAHALDSILHTIDNKPCFFKNCHCDFRIQIIILCQQNMFSTQFFCRKSTFPRFFCKFSAKDVENRVETVENSLLFQQKKLLHNTIAHKVKSICTFV